MKPQSLKTRQDVPIYLQNTDFCVVYLLIIKRRKESVKNLFITKSKEMGSKNGHQGSQNPEIAMGK